MAWQRPHLTTTMLVSEIYVKSATGQASTYSVFSTVIFGGLG